MMPAAELWSGAWEPTPAAVRARFERARRAGHPAWLWPEVEQSAWRGALGRLEAITRSVLAGAKASPPLAPRDEAEAGALALAAYTSGMGPLLGYWLEGGRVDADAATSALLATHLRHGRARLTWATARTLELTDRLQRAGVEVSVLKGLHTAHAYFPEPGTRPVADVDLLVMPGDMPAAENALAAAGLARLRVQRRPYKTEWAPPGSERLPRSLLLSHAEDPLFFDVHATLDRNFFGVACVRLADVADRGARWPAGGSASVLGQPLLALTLATHASEGLHSLNLLRIVELALMLRRDTENGALSWEDLVAAAEAAGALRYAWPALELCERLAPGTMPGWVLAAFAAAATPAMRAVVARRTPGCAQNLGALSLEERLMWAGTRRERWRRVVHAAWPAPAGRSLQQLASIYAERAWQIVRGTVER